MAVCAQDFTYNGKALSSFDTEYLLIDIDETEDSPGISRAFQQSALTNDNSVVYFYDAIGSSLIEFDITICRKDGADLTPANSKELSDWLMGEVIPREAFFTSCQGESAVYDDTYYIGGFTNSTYAQVGSNRRFAMTFHFTNISPFGFTAEETYVVPGTIVNSGSRTGEPIYPLITIVPSRTGTVTINNTDDPSVGAFSIEVHEGTTVIVNDRNLLTSGGLLYSFDNLNNFYWPALVDGENHIEVTGDATVTMTTRFYKNLGV